VFLFFVCIIIPLDMTLDGVAFTCKPAGQVWVSGHIMIRCDLLGYTLSASKHCSRI
jgi:hypothetical protein